MSDILSAFYNKRYSNEPVNVYFTHRHNMTIRDPKLETQGYYTFLSSTQRLPPFTPNFINKNKDVTDMKNIFFQKSSPITYLRKTYTSSQTSCLSSTNKTPYYLIDKEKILKEANDKAEKIINSNQPMDKDNYLNREIHSHNEIKEQTIDPRNNVNKRIGQESKNSSLIKSRQILSSI